MSPLLKRVTAALLAIPIFLWITCGAPVWFFDLTVVAALLAALVEVYRMAGGRPGSPLSGVGFLAMAMLTASAASEPYGFGLREASVVALLLLTVGYLVSGRTLGPAAASISMTAFGAFYLGVFGSFFLLLRRLPDGASALLILYAATWAYDTGGYFVGKSLGKHKLTPQVSPNKTWEGLAGGTLLCLLVVGCVPLFAPAWGARLSLPVRLLLALLLAAGAQVGDLVESLLKRSLNAKDSGVFLPGHGGMFDRIDSLLFNAPLLYYVLERLTGSRPFGG
jgi:phosphatidate cytidylyltransferase